MTDSVSHRLKALQQEWLKEADRLEWASMQGDDWNGGRRDALKDCADALTPLIASVEGRGQEHRDALQIELDRVERKALEMLAHRQREISHLTAENHRLRREVAQGRRSDEPPQKR